MYIVLYFVAVESGLSCYVTTCDHGPVKWRDFASRDKILLREIT